LANVAVRREWWVRYSPKSVPFTDKPRSTLTNAERKAYTDAVLCLQAKPALTNQTLVPGAKSRYGT
jgi:tyrosinase